MMVDKIQEHSIRNMFSSILFALIVISLLIALVFGNYKVVLIVIISNLLPLLVCGALMALLGIELRYGTSVIFTIGFVIALDDTIHFMTKFQLEKSKGKPTVEAVRLTLFQTGRAILTTSVVLFFGFLILLFSDFRDSKAIGILVSFMLVGALVTDLYLVPVLLIKFLSDEN